MTTENTKPLSRLISVKVAQEHLNCSRSFVYKLMDEGILDSVKIGKARRILEQSLIKLMEEGHEAGSVTNDNEAN